MLIPAMCRGQIHRTNSLVVHMAGTNFDKKKKQKKNRPGMSGGMKN